MEVNKKHIIAIDLILVVGSILLIAYIVGYSTPLVISPIDDLNTTNTAVLFEFENAQKILIDENMEFTSPHEIYVEDNLVVNLKPGTYYWKVIGTSESEIRKLTILSEVNLKLRQNEDSIEIVNSGNTELNVDIYDLDTKVGSIELDIDESKNVSGTKFIGGDK